MNKLATAFGGLLMIGAVLAPLAMAHGDSGVAVSPVMPAGFRGSESVHAGKTPAGFYYGSASAWLQLNAQPVGPGGSPPGCPTGNSQVDDLVCALILSVDPSFTLAAADSLCDMEVSGDGANVFATDEPTVDGLATAGLGVVPDGLFNDGGVGAVCHTPDGFYDTVNYNTNGCTAGTATADDLVSGGNVWISATCDSTTPVAGDGLLTQVLSTESCIANDVLSSNEAGIVSCVTYLVDCLAPTADPTTNPCAGTSGVTCGADGVADGSPANNIGSTGAAYPGVHTGCTSTPSSEATFLWNSVQVTQGNNSPYVSLATTGWVK